MEALQRRQESILERIQALGRKLDQMTCNTSVCENPFSSRRRGNSLIEDPHGTMLKLSKDLETRGVRDYAFVRAPTEYYDKDLEFRRNILDASSIHHLCKSIIMENTRVEEDEQGVVKYWLVIVQYSSRLDSEVLRTHVYNHHKGLVSRGKINMRLVSEEKSYELSGFKKNAVTPVGMKVQLPIVLAKEIADLSPDEFWIGAGEVDLKIGMRVSDFIKAYNPMIVSLGSKD